MSFVDSAQDDIFINRTRELACLSEVRLTAATNVFVGVTRPRELQGLALRKSEAMVLIGPATDQGWKLVDLVAQAAELTE